MDIKNQIVNYCNQIGISEVGFCKCEVFYDLKELLELRKKMKLQNEFEEDNIDKRINPCFYMEDGKTIISIAIPYFYGTETESSEYFSIYTWGQDYHKVVSKYLEKICKFIEEIGGNAKYFVDSNALPERYIAEKSGVGFIGKNNLLINKRYGSYVFLGEIITNLNIEPDEPIKKECGMCTLCVDNCPTKAIGSNYCNPNVCLSYITQKKDIEDVWFSKLEGRIFGCDTCQKQCPFNLTADCSAIEELLPYEFMLNTNVNELLYLDNKTFKEKYALTSSGWRGKNIIQRNLLISLLNRKFKPNLLLENIKSPYIKDYYGRLLHYFKL